MNINASAPADYQLKVMWERPADLFPFGSVNITVNGSLINSTWYATTVLNVNYTVTCNSADAPTIQGTTQNEFLVFNQGNGVRAGTDYTCHVTMTVKAYNGTLGGGNLGSIVVRTTPKSEESSITTLEGNGMNSIYHGFSASQSIGGFQYDVIVYILPH